MCLESVLILVELISGLKISCAKYSSLLRRCDHVKKLTLVYKPE